ncbi:MAG: hypothetical protein BGO26_02240 [Actinobacteria bacterium 69-20]|nr:MarR family transcriptional regulator [Actinomycetota bacterium]OJV31289.1 MAG: hypothetical protein BGO26_02240 [Actinobacteria bacterium 69-20]
MRSKGPSLLPIFRSRYQAELLTWLLLHPDEEFGLSDLAKRLAVGPSTLHREVDRLEEAGLLRSRSIGRNRMLRANMAHPAAPSLTRLLEVVFGPRVVVAEEFASLHAEDIVIFGSWAARYAGEDGPPPHDIDVLVVGDGLDRSDVYDAADRVHGRLGVEVNPVLRNVRQWAAPSDTLVTQIKGSPHFSLRDVDEGVNV